MHLDVRVGDEENYDYTIYNYFIIVSNEAKNIDFLPKSIIEITQGSRKCIVRDAPIDTPYFEKVKFHPMMID